MRYLDTSLVVAALTREARSPEAAEWLAIQPVGSVVISDWVITEFSAALSLKVRTGQLQSSERWAALTTFDRFTEEALEVLPVSRRSFITAAAFANRPDVAVRAGDVLHLALAAEHGAEIITLDRRLAASGQLVGVRTSMLDAVL